MKTITAPAPVTATETPTAPAPAETAGTPSPADGQPTTPAQLQDVKLAQLLDQRPSFDTLKALGLAKLTELARENVQTQNRVKTAQDKFKRTAKGVGKVLAAMKTAYADAQDAGTLARGTSFEDYHKSVTGEKPWNHAMQCARVFLQLVLTGRLPEQDYDRRAADWHQIASVILGVITENGGNLDTPEVAELVGILKNAADDEGAKKLRELRKRLKGGGAAEGETGDENILTVTDLKNADVLVRRICGTDYEANGHKTHGLTLTTNIVKEYIGKETREDVLRSVFHTLYDAMDVFPRELADKFMGEIEIARVEREATAAAPATPEAPVAAAA